MFRFHVVLLFLASSFAPSHASAQLATLNLPAPIQTWEKGIPLGNGATGGILWGGGTTVNLSLDRGDLWDLRTPEIYKRNDWNYATLQHLLHAGDEKQIHALFDAPYGDLAYPTKVPAGRLALSFPQAEQVSAFSLDAHRAEGKVALGTQNLTAFFAATSPVALLRISGTVTSLSLKGPSGVEKLGYPPARFGDTTKSGVHTIWMLQQGAQGLRYAIIVASRQQDHTTTVAVAIVSNREGKDPVEIGERRTSQALARGYDAVFAAHLAWWKQFWATSTVNVPDAAVQQQYVLDKYFYGSASRKGAPPMPLQSVWTADEGGLPPWKGDYHNDLNTELMYLAAPEAGLFDQGGSFLDFNWKLLPVYQRFARSFYNVPGAVVPGVEALDGQPLGGWAQYAFSPTLGAWIAQSFYLHWRYTMDPVFLRTRAYPFTEQIGTALLALLKPGADGKLKLPLSSSPEYSGDSMKAWLPPNSNFDLALLHFVYSALAEMADAEKNPVAAARWRNVLTKLDDFSVENGKLTLAPGIPFAESHRHLSHLIAIHPLGLLTIDGGPEQRQLIDRSVDDFLSKGTQEWTGYTYSWVACLLARIGRGDQALQYLQSYLRGFIFPNGFHVNGDQSGTGLSGSNDHPFTLEGNFLAMQSVQEMLLQSWGNQVRIFPAVPSTWKDVSFENLRAEGGYIVSAKSRNGHTVCIRVTATTDGMLKLRNPFDVNAQVQWDFPIKQNGTDVEVLLRKGQTLTAWHKSIGANMADER
jgi:alpha-L-fucosidase 2